MSLRLRLLLAAAGIVLISLLTSGALSLILVRSLEFDTAQVDLDRLSLTARHDVLRAECQTAQPQPRIDCVGGRLAPRDVYHDRLAGLSHYGSADRMLLVNSAGVIVFDSMNDSAVGSRVTAARSRRIDQDFTSEGDLRLGGENYIGAAAVLNFRPQAAARVPRAADTHDPLGADRVVLLRSAASINAIAVRSLLPLLVGAALIALAVALVVALVLSRAVARPLSELAAAAEEIAAGNYSRRVRRTSRDEIGVVGSSFNRMGEAVERARTIQREFLANVSHELKTPLTSLIGFSQALVDGSLQTPEQRTRAAEIIHEEARRVLRMSQELLDLARVESGHISIQLGDVDLKALLEQELELVKPRAEERRLRLELEVPESMPPVRADLEKVHQIIDNLLDNAVKYAPEGTSIQVVTHSSLMSVEVWVGNEVGKHAPDPERIFDRFYRADPSRSSAAGGVGLGLAISRELARTLGGRLTAELVGNRLKMSLTLPSIG